MSDGSGAAGAQRRERLARARLTVCLPIRPDLDAFLDAILGAGVDVVQLRDKHAEGLALIQAGERFRTAADRAGALFVVNDRLDIAQACGADGVHVGQDDLPPTVARALGGPDILIGRSTHSVAEIEAARAEPVDYIGVGPVDATPTKPGRPGVGLGLVSEASTRWSGPFFVTGGMNAATIPAAMAAGAFGVVVVRALTEADDPGATAADIRRVLDAVS